jgi:tRNA pseudouridine synthase 10
VEELIVNNLKSLLRSDCIKFSSSGREDVDVRMLGRGRPFLLEVTNPRKTKFLDEEFMSLCQKINSSDLRIGVRDVQTVSK